MSAISPRWFDLKITPSAGLSMQEELMGMFCNVASSDISSGWTVNRSLGIPYCEGVLDALKDVLDDALDNALDNALDDALEEF